MNAINLATADKATITKVAKSESKAAKARRAPSKGKVIQAPTVDAQQSTAGAGVMSALTTTLSQKAKAAAKAVAVKAIAKAKKPTAPAPAALSEKLTALYVVGAYNGRAGAMHDFIARCTVLQAKDGGFSRESVVASFTAKPAGLMLTNRAQALDYFAWADRHGLVVGKGTKVVNPVRKAIDDKMSAAAQKAVEAINAKAVAKTVKAAAKPAAKKASKKAAKGAA